MTTESRTSTVTINAAFLQEIKEVNQDLWKLLDEVRHLCSDAHHVQLQGRRVVEKTAELRDQLAMHFALEEAYGYFDDPIHVAPRLSAAACQLRSEHQLLYTMMRDLAEDVDGWYRSGVLTHRGAQVVRLFRECYERLQQHENRESELILDASDSDLGVGD